MLEPIDIGIRVSSVWRYEQAPHGGGGRRRAHTALSVYPILLLYCLQLSIIACPCICHLSFVRLPHGSRAHERSGRKHRASGRRSRTGAGVYRVLEFESREERQGAVESERAADMRREFEMADERDERRERRERERAPGRPWSQGSTEDGGLIANGKWKMENGNRGRGEGKER